MGLKTTQQTALDNLVTLITYATTGIRKVWPDGADSISALPCLVIDDGGMMPRRAGQWQEIEWPLSFTLFVQTVNIDDAGKSARDIRGDLIDRLDTDITLGGAVSRTTWREPGLEIVDLEWGTVKYVGLRGIYVLWLKEGKAFA